MPKKIEKQKNLFQGKILQMPEGYYSSDKPNPNLRSFVEACIKEHPYDPENDDYNVPAFDKPIQTTKIDPIYNLHPYDSKKSHSAIGQYVRHYCSPGDLVLDPFVGSGSALVAASACGCPSIGIDFSPLSTFIASESVLPTDIDIFQESFEKLTAIAKDKILRLYATTCHRCGVEATILGSVISETFQCIRCLEVVPFYSCIPTNHEAKRLCPVCNRRGVESIITTSFERRGSRIVEIAFRCHGSCRPKRMKRSILDDNKQARTAFDKDVSKAESIIAQNIPNHIKQRMLAAPEKTERWGLLWRPYLRGFERVEDFFTTRNLQACVYLLNAIQKVNNFTLLIVLSSILAKCSHLMAQNPDGIGRVMKGTYYVGAMRREINVWEFFLDAFKAVRDAKMAINSAMRAPVLISCQNSCDLSAIPSNTVDYIFTDPPYSGKVQFGEINFLREAFLNIGVSRLQDEIIVNEERGLTESDWSARMRKVANEMFRVLKPGRWVTLCYHDTSEGTWANIQDIMAEVGLISDGSHSSVYIETRQKSIKQITADKVNKRDLVINFRKPRSGEVTLELSISGKEDNKTFNERVRSIIKEHLESHPGSTKDRIYDEVVSHMVRAGKMEVHDFEGLLKQVAEEVKESVKKTLLENEDPNLFGTHEISRWYLKETQFTEADAAESAKEDAAAQKMESFIGKKVKEQPWLEGVHYSDIFEHYIYSVKDKPRRQLAEWLLDYFYKTDAGTYRLALSEDEKHLKAEGRSKGIQRRIKHFITYLQQGVAIPSREQPNDATLAEWLRYCKRSGLYELGKLLYEKGGLTLDNLSEEATANAEEDYQVCVLMLARTDDGHKKGKRRK